MPRDQHREKDYRDKDRDRDRDDRFSRSCKLLHSSAIFIGFEANLTTTSICSIQTFQFIARQFTTEMELRQ